MAYRANPFLDRMSERTTSDQEFVQLFSPKILERLAEDAFQGAIHIFRSPPGGGKTTLLRAFTPSALQAFWNARSVQDMSESYQRLSARQIGEGRVSQLQKVMTSAIPTNAEICPILPHPSGDPRRADRLLVEYRQPLFDARGTPAANVLYAHEAHPFEAYRQMLGAMTRYRDSLKIMGGCRLVVTPLGSKLITLGVGLACFEMRPAEMTADYGIAIPYSEPTRYVVSSTALKESNPDICCLLLTGEAYDGRIREDTYRIQQ